MKNIFRILIFILGVVSVGTLTSCNSADDTSDNNVEPKTDTVIIKAMKFVPDSLTINQGDTVIWINQGIVVHTVTEYPDSTFNDSLDVGETLRMTPDKSFNYFCTIHPTMKGVITVVKK